MQRFKWIIAIMFVMVTGVCITFVGGLRPVSKEVDLVAMEMPETELMSVVLDNAAVVRPYTTYTVELSIDEDYESFEGIANVLYTHEYERPTSEIIMNANLMEIKSININSDLVPFEQKGANILIRPPFSIEKGEELTITIEFQGKLDKQKQNPNSGVYLGHVIPTILTYDEYSGWARTSSADIDVLRLIEPANYKVTVHTHKGQYPIGTGTISGIIETEDMVTTTFGANRVRGFGLFIGDQMEREIYNTEEGYSVVLYYKDRTKAVDELLSEVIISLKTYGDTFGTYPYDQLTVIHKAGLAKEAYPTLLMGDFSGQVALGKDVNELVGKQWLYYVIGNINEKECWLSKGLLEYLNKRSLFSPGQMAAYVAEEKSHELATSMFYEIEERIGRETFVEALRTYYRNYSFKMASGEEFIETVEDVSGKNIRDIYNIDLIK